MDFYHVAQQVRPVVYQAGELARSYSLHVTPERKADRSFVTEADRQVETFLKEEILKRFPDHGIIGEEFGSQGVDDAESVWALDPIDGTAPFVYELPVWAISVGLLHEKRAVLGFVYLPIVHEMYWAIEGGPAYLNNRKITVHDPCTMTRGTCIVAPSLFFKGMQVRYEGRALSFGSAAAHICYVARGNIQGGILKRVRLWDIAASAAILNAAGGELRYLSGREVDLGELIDGRKTPEPFVIGHPHNTLQLMDMFD